jgi:flagellar hook-associated protein 3 FlgL
VSSARITTSMVQRNILANLNSVNDRLTRTQEQAASGKQINRPSDDPFNTGRALSLRDNLAANQKYQRNINDAQGWQDSTETALDSITKYVQRVKDLLVEGSADTADQTSRDAAADEIDQIIQGIKEDANTTYNGAYVFGGTTTATPPYAMGASDTYQGDGNGSGATAGVLREIGPGVTMSINTVGLDFLGNGQPAAGGTGDDKVFNVLRDISAHLRAGDGASLRGTDMTRLDANLDDVLAARSRNGAQTNRLDAAMSRMQDLETATTKQLSDTEDADFAKTIMDLNTQSAAYQAALRAGATIVQTSLLDFLK